MLNEQRDPLFGLIKSLSKSEKRQFKLYVGRLGVNTDAKFITLFILMDKMKIYDDKFLYAAQIVKRQQLSNLKAHLYKQILISLRLNPLHQQKRIQLREQLDFATILYHKGLYKQSLKILEKAKTSALESEEKNIAYQIIEFEKNIESQYVTRNLKNRARQLASQAQDLSEMNVLTSKLSNLSIELYAIILHSGYVKNDEEFKEITRYFFNRLPDVDFYKLGFMEKLWYYKSHLWYSLLVQDFLSSFKYANKWVDLFYESTKMIEINPVFFIKGNQYLFESLFFLKHKSKFKTSLHKMESVIDTSISINDNVSSLLFLCVYQNKLNLHFLDGSFEKGILIIPEILNGIKKHNFKIDQHHIMVLYYKIACMYFGVENYELCILYLEKIINNKNLKIREDLMCFSRVLSVVAHYDSGQDYKIDSQLKSTYKFLIKMNELQQVQKEMIRFLRSLVNMYPNELKQAFKTLHAQLLIYEKDPYEKRAFLYLDIISWLESKIQNRSISSIIKEKSQYLIR